VGRGLWVDSRFTIHDSRFTIHDSRIFIFLRMDETHRQHPIASVPGAWAVAVWSVYVLLAAFFYSPDIPPSVLTIGISGILTCLAVVLNFAYWRLILILASSVYLSFYATRVIRMVALTPDFGLSTLPSGLAFYYGSSWHVTVGMLQERGVAGSLTHGFLEYAMPILSLALIALALMSRRSRRSASQAG
jgi:hypothetical protein